MAENIHRMVGSEQEIPNVHTPFPGIAFCFLETPDRIGDEFSRSQESGFVLHYCHAGHIVEECDCAEITSGDIWIVPACSALGSITLLSKEYAGVSMRLEPETAQGAIGAFFESCLGTELDLTGLAGILQQNRGMVISGDRLSRVFSQLFQESPPCKEGFYRLKAMELLLYLVAWQPERPEKTTLYLDRELMGRVAGIHQFLKEHLDTHLTQAQIADQYHISLTALKRAFFSMYGLTMAAYLREQRISVAKQLLLETKLPVSEIAHRVGYESHSQFTAAFRSSQGQTPAAFRQSCRDSLVFGK